MQYLIGIDLGTQGTKTTLCDEDGIVLSEAFEPSRLIYPQPGAVEQEPEEMLDSVLNTIQQVVVKSGVEPGNVAGIGLSGQMAGTMGIDSSGKAVTPYDSWLDTRCGRYRKLFLDLGEEKVIQITGAPVTYAHGPKILWWKHEHPEIFSRVSKFIMPAAYCIMRMCGLDSDSAFIDHTYLHFTGFADTENSIWSNELLEGLEVDSAKMPRIVKPYEKMGSLTQEMAERSGLLEGTPLVAGCGDTAASSFGAGILYPGLLFDVAGTASVFACATDVYSPDIKNKTIMFPRSIVDGLFTPMAYISGGGMCLKWFRDDVMEETRSYDELNESAALVASGSENLFFVPHFSGRVCPNDPHVKGSYINLSRQHGFAHMYRAILEGIAYEYRIYADIILDLVPQTRFERVIAIGGGSKSILFNQIKSDILGVPVSTISHSDTAAIACCVIAGYGTGLYDSLDLPIKKLVKLNAEVTPNSSLYNFYGKRKEIYSELFPALRNVYHKIESL